MIEVLKDISVWNGGSENKFLAQQLLSKLWYSIFYSTKKSFKISKSKI